MGWISCYDFQENQRRSSFHTSTITGLMLSLNLWVYSYAVWSAKCTSNFSMTNLPSKRMVARSDNGRILGRYDFMLSYFTMRTTHHFYKLVHAIDVLLLTLSMFLSHFKKTFEENIAWSCANEQQNAFEELNSALATLLRGSSLGCINAFLYICILNVFSCIYWTFLYLHPFFTYFIKISIYEFAKFSLLNNKKL